MQVPAFYFLPFSTQCTAAKQNVTWKSLSFLTCLSSLVLFITCSLSNHQLPQMFVSQFCWLRSQTVYSIISQWRKKVFCIRKNTLILFSLSSCLGFYINKYSMSLQLTRVYLMKQGRKTILFGNNNNNNLTNNKLMLYLSMFYMQMPSFCCPACFTAFFRSVKTNIRNLQKYFSFLYCRNIVSAESLLLDLHKDKTASFARILILASC